MVQTNRLPGRPVNLSRWVSLAPAFSPRSVDVSKKQKKTKKKQVNLINPDDDPFLYDATAHNTRHTAPVSRFLLGPTEDSHLLPCGRGWRKPFCSRFADIVLLLSVTGTTGQAEFSTHFWPAIWRSGEKGTSRGIRTRGLCDSGVPCQVSLCCCVGVRA